MGRNFTDWQAEEYARTMGVDALQRQKLAGAKDTRSLVCNCAQKATPRAQEPSAYHKFSCPLYRPDEA